MPYKTPEQLALIVDKAYKEMKSKRLTEKRVKCYMTLLYSIGEFDGAHSNGRHRPVDILHPVSGEVLNAFPSVAHAARHLKVEPQSVSQAADRGTKCGGFRIRYRDSVT